MLFNSYEFILFLPLALAAHFLAARWSISAAVATTTISSLIFYAWWKPPFVVLPIASIVLNYWLASRILASPIAERRPLVLAGVAANVLVLAYFKYFDFILSIFEQRSASVPDVPLALSFTTFVQIAFLVELARHPEKVAPAKYAMFVAFFPHLIAGPIVRWSELGPQLDDRGRYRINWDNVALGLTIFLLGLAKKILLADQLSPHVSLVFDAAAAGQPIGAAAAWGASIAYSLQLFFDFSAYSDMAVGLGLLFNLRLPVNFAAPLRSTSIIDLWRRWHISLSRFLRDFIYVPLGGGKKGGLRQCANLFVTMLIGGLWHGANWTFIAWGAFHGALLTLNHIWRLLRGPVRPTMIGRSVGWLLTFAAFAVGMTMFRAANIETAGSLLQAMAGFGPGASDVNFNPAPDFWFLRQGYVSEEFVRTWFGAHWSISATLLTAAALAVMLLVPDTMELTNYRENEPHSDWRRSYGLTWTPSAAWCAGAVVLFAVLFARLNQFTEFLYYQF
ncbi:MBOAT family O-acyltransferase [Bradyrhizobium sp. LHD-71]|uniref:MBOAT family O-acyltransferase n=1 Tax=Bradyrhizobium sp. LHD-71 TaxID=3072141 RepID=UPI00280CD9BE|nr:MBOAT family O-acyltransferase [Bradyrhizobium sp. LHD-71]MDQ8726501.1 MBOAT family O-acyltransferase [Bradyrhizobium sp. LHD-71]